MEKIKKILSEEKPRYKKITKYIWIFFIFILLFIPLFFYSVKIDLFGLYGPMPPLTVLENPENDLSSEVITSDGVSLGRYYRYNRSQVKFDELSDELVTTLIDSEDIRFHKHSGIDLRSLIRAIVGQLTFNPAGGGSTITQQLAKNLYTQNEELGLDGHIAKLGRYPQRINQKIKEWIISIYLEKNFTKEEILTMYLNTAPFSNNAYGIKVAAETYFGTTPDSLNYTQSAVLVGLLQAITRFNPTLNPEASFDKRNQVLRKVVRNGHMDQATYDSISQLPIDLSRASVESHNKGSATYFRTVLRTELMEWCKENGYDLFDDGLKVFITIDSRMQQYAEEAVKDHMAGLQEQFFKVWKGRNPWVDDDWREIEGFIERKYKSTPSYRSLIDKYGEDSDSVEIMMNLPRPMRVFSWNGEIDTVMSPLDSLKYYKHFLHTGFMSMDPLTGQVKAWVGGINHKYFQFDHVKQGTRQPGSTFKTFVYGLAMLQDYSPCREFVDESPTFSLPEGKLWRPMNAEGGYGTGETMTMRQAMARSVNSITAQLMKSLGVQNVVDFAHQVGIKSPLDPVPSLCLGTSDVNIYELVGAYGTFVNKGVYTEPYYIAKIEDKYGNIIYNAVPESEVRLDEQTAYKILYMLKGGVEEEGGTSRGLSWEVKKDNEIGGKTGTTNNASDGWYIGVTKNLISGVWVGGDERSIHFRSWADGQGGRTARPIWDMYMQKVYADKSLGFEKGEFERPLAGIDKVLDCEQHTLAATDTTMTQQQTDWETDFE